MTAETEDYRVKNAREGRAVYVSGRTAEEIAVDDARGASRREMASTCSISLKQGDWDALDTAIPDTLEALNDVENIFFMLAWADDLEHLGIRSMMRLAARAIASMKSEEFDVLDRLDTAIREHPKRGQEQ